MKVFYAVLLTAAAVFYVLYQDNLSFLLLLTLIIFPFILLFCLIINIVFMKVKVTADSDTTEHGKPVKLRIRIMNKSFFPVSCCNIIMKYTDLDKKIQKFFTEIPLPARSSESVIFSIKAEHCGVIDCSVDKVIISDLIGLLTIPKRVGFCKTIPVLPVCYPFEAPVVNNMNTDDESGVFSEHKPGDNPSEVHDLRDYREGDSQNRIHWKLSSRYDGLIVRELSEPVSGSVLLIPDLFSCADKKQTDDVLDLYATISGFLSEKRLKHSVIAYDDNGITLKNISSPADSVSLLQRQVRSINAEKPSPDAWTDALNELPAFTKYTHIICFVSGIRADVLYEIEMMGIAERISVICLGCAKGDEIESKLSEIVFYNTSVESFYEDLRFFTV